MSKHLHSTKVSLLADTKSEGMFYKSYATKQLLLLSGKAPMIVAKKKDTEPWLTEGPIVSTPVVRWVKKGKGVKTLLIHLMEIAKEKEGTVS